MKIKDLGIPKCTLKVQHLDMRQTYKFVWPNITSKPIKIMMYIEMSLVKKCHEYNQDSGWVLGFFVSCLFLFCRLKLGFSCHQPNCDNSYETLVHLKFN